MAQYKGSNADGTRAMGLAKLREEHQAEFERQKRLLKEASRVSDVTKMDERFQSQDTRVEEQFKKSTVGLVSAEDFKKKRQEAEARLKLEDEARQLQHERVKQRKAEKRKTLQKALTFADDLEDPGDSEVTVPPMANGSDAASDDSKSDPPLKKKKSFGKNPDVNTAFLPDRQRELEEKELKRKLEEEWKASQEEIKKELIEVTYSYWDGSGHRRTVKVPKGTKISQFLETCRRDLQDAFHELRATSAENLMYIKEDLIIPHNYSFYDLIISKARGKSGPLFHFDVHDDVRLLQNVKIEKDESHAGKIVTRGWYERNKHIFPASRWEVYDPSVKRAKYTIKGDEVR